VRPPSAAKGLNANCHLLQAHRLSTSPGSNLLQLVTISRIPHVIEGTFDPAFLELRRNPDHRDARPPEIFRVESAAGNWRPTSSRSSISQGFPGTGPRRPRTASCARALPTPLLLGVRPESRLADILPKLDKNQLRSRLAATTPRSNHARHRSLARRAVVQPRHDPAHVADADRAAELAKCDLATEMVREFTELQASSAASTPVPKANRKCLRMPSTINYRPWARRSHPAQSHGCAVALARQTRLSRRGFSVGVIPTGSRRSYALRRAALAS